MSSAMTWPFQLTAARRRLVVNWLTALGAWWFQLTAARRRLGDELLRPATASLGFNSQPPEGGWIRFSQTPTP